MKTETEQEKQKRREKKAAELSRLEKAGRKKTLVHGFWFLLIILTVIYIADVYDI